MNIARYIDHTLLKPTATIDQIKQLCQEAIEHKFCSVCVNPCHVYLCREELHETAVDVCTVIGFPLGANCTSTKFNEAVQAIRDGADELDVVMNIGYLLSGGAAYYDAITNELVLIANLAHSLDVIVKVIIETGLLTDKQKVLACRLAVGTGVDFVKTCTGFNGGQATVEDIRLIKKAVGYMALIKASGGIKDYATALAMFEAGADRLGTSSGVKIVQEEKEALENQQ